MIWDFAFLCSSMMSIQSSEFGTMAKFIHSLFIQNLWQRSPEFVSKDSM